MNDDVWTIWARCTSSTAIAAPRTDGEPHIGNPLDERLNCRTLALKPDAIAADRLAPAVTPVPASLGTRDHFEFSKLLQAAFVEPR